MRALRQKHCWLINKCLPRCPVEEMRMLSAPRDSTYGQHGSVYISLIERIDVALSREDVLRKIRGCLGMATSDNPDIAATAARQAQALMAQYDIEHPEILASGISEEFSPSRATRKPPAYEVLLAETIAGLFSCSLIFTHKWERKLTGGYSFMGAGPSAEVAAYTFSVLSRKLRDARETYTQEKLQRYRRNKVAAADEFCNGWVFAVRSTTQAAAPTGERLLAIEAYQGRKYPKVGALTTSRRELANEKLSDQHQNSGWAEGKKTKIDSGISGPGKQEKLLFNSAF